jgi:hypothetical protein
LKIPRLLGIAAWLVLAVASGAAGYYYGVRKGVDVMGDLENDGHVSTSIRRIDASLTALEQPGDTALALRQHEEQLDSAMLQLGERGPSTAGWRTCYPRERAVMERVRAYRVAHPRQPGHIAEVEREYDAALGMCRK